MFEHLFGCAYEQEFNPMKFIHSFHTMNAATFVPVRCACAVKHLYRERFIRNRFSLQEWPERGALCITHAAQSLIDLLCDKVNGDFQCDLVILYNFFPECRVSCFVRANVVYFRIHTFCMP